MSAGAIDENVRLRTFSIVMVASYGLQKPLPLGQARISHDAFVAGNGRQDAAALRDDGRSGRLMWTPERPGGLLGGSFTRACFVAGGLRDRGRRCPSLVTRKPAALAGADIVQ